MNRLIGFRLNGIHWSGDGLTVSCVKEVLDAGATTVAGAFLITFVDEVWVAADSGVVSTVIDRVEEADPDPALLDAIHEGTSERERAALRLYRFYGSEQSTPHLRVLAQGLTIREAPARAS